MRSFRDRNVGGADVSELDNGFGDLERNKGSGKSEKLVGKETILEEWEFSKEENR